MNSDTSGQAFPSQKWAWVASAQEYQPSGSEPGMTLRDYFAAKAMQGELASMCVPDADICGVALDASDDTMARLAQHYYRMADAMLAARSKP